MMFLWGLIVLLIPFGGCEKQRVPRPYKVGDRVRYPDNYCDQISNSEEFDFIVVGAGPAGVIVARRLAEIPRNRVLLIEGGDDPPPSTDIPGKALDVISHNKDIRYFWTAKGQEEVCQAINDQRCPIVPAKVLGGCSVINFLMNIRGNAMDYDRWASLGNDGWSYEEILPYFKKMENYKARPLIYGHKKVPPSVPAASAKYHGTGGPFTTATFDIDQQSQPLREAIIKASNDVGIPTNYDALGASQMGITEAPGFIDTQGYRNNVAKAYLLNIPDNLKVCKNAMVDKVGLRFRRADNVEILHRKFTGPFGFRGPFGLKRYVVKAKKEIIITAGALSSPGILERSGIGNPFTLLKAGVLPRHKLDGVGENFHDQFVNFGNAFYIDYNTNVSNNPLTTGMTSLTTFINTEDPAADHPDVQFIVKTYESAFGKALQLSKSIIDQLENAGSELLFYGNVVLIQEKPGHVHITQSRSPAQSPEILINQYQTNKDKNSLVRSARLSRKMMAHPALTPFNVKPFIFDECRKYEFNSKEEIMCAAKLFATTLYHHTGTCKMGPSTDRTAVVDNELRVYGIKNLRVADASIMPIIPSGNTQVPTMMIAEKAADMIKRSWGQI